MFNLFWEQEMTIFPSRQAARLNPKTKPCLARAVKNMKSSRPRASSNPLSDVWKSLVFRAISDTFLCCLLTYISLIAPWLLHVTEQDSPDQFKQVSMFHRTLQWASQLKRKGKNLSFFIKPAFACRMVDFCSLKWRTCSKGQVVNAGCGYW